MPASAPTGVHWHSMIEDTSRSTQCEHTRCARHGPGLLQVGESMQIHSGGLLQATPHFVRSASSPAAAGVSRNTFAVFMQPR